MADAVSHDVSVDVCSVDVWPGSEANGTGRTGVHASHMTAGNAGTAATEASRRAAYKAGTATTGASANSTTVAPAATSGKEFSRW